MMDISFQKGFLRFIDFISLMRTKKFLGKLMKGEKLMATQKIRIKLNAFDHNLIDVASKRIVDTALKFGAKISGPIPLPTNREVVTVIRATHKYQDSREQFELRTHKRLIDIYSPSAKAVDALMKIDLPAGVDIKIKL